MANSKPRIVLQFNEFDFRHRKVLEILRARPRNITDLVVNAVLHFVSCPDAETEFSRALVREVVIEVLHEMQEAGSLVTGASSNGSTNTLSPEDENDLGSIMSAFRGG